jgi:GNAT superfamily N-acetyltransferase
MSGHSLRIRKATEADLPVLTAMTREFNDLLDVLGGDPPSEDAAEFAAGAMPRLRSFAFGPSPLCTVLIAELDGETAGYLTYFIGVYMDDATPALHVADFFVSERYRRRGVGKALMLDARRIAADRGASRLLWTVWRRNNDAIRFYENLGAELEPYDGSVLMQWLIKS